MTNTDTKSVSNIKERDFVSFFDNGKHIKGVVTKVDDLTIEVEATSRYIQKDDFWQLYQMVYTYVVPKKDITIEKCKCDRVIHETIERDNGNGFFDSAFCPDCYWDCVS